MGLRHLHWFERRQAWQQRSKTPEKRDRRVAFWERTLMTLVTNRHAAQPNRFQVFWGRSIWTVAERLPSRLWERRCELLSSTLRLPERCRGAETVSLG